MPRLLNWDIIGDPMNFIRVMSMVLFSLAIIFAVFTHMDASASENSEG